MVSNKLLGLGMRRWIIFCLLLDSLDVNPILQFIFIDMGGILILILYVDDLILIGSSPAMIKDTQGALMEYFDMPDLGLLHYFLGLQIH